MATFVAIFFDLCKRIVGLPRYIYMQDKKQLDYYEAKQDKTEPFQEQYLPTGYDWRLSNCDERRSGPCKKVDNVKHKFH